MSKNKNKKIKVEPLTDLELTVMNTAWQLENFIVADVVEHLVASQKKKYAYTTIATIIKILEKKKYIKSTKSGKAYQYSILLSKEVYEGSALTNLVSKVFDGSVDKFVGHLLGSAKLTNHQLNKIKETFTKRFKND